MLNGQKADFVLIAAKAWPETQPEPAEKLSVTISRTWDVRPSTHAGPPGRHRHNPVRPGPHAVATRAQPRAMAATRSQ